MVPYRLLIIHDNRSPAKRGFYCFADFLNSRLTLRQEMAIRDSHTTGELSPVFGTSSYSLEAVEELEGFGAGCEADAAGPPEISLV